MQQLRALLICLGACLFMGAMNAIPNTSENEDARDEAAGTVKNSHVGGMGGAWLRGYGMAGAGFKGYAMGGGGRRKRVTGGYRGGADVRPGSFSPDFGFGNAFDFGGGGEGGSGKRRKRVADGYGGGKEVDAGSQSTGMEYGGGMVGGWRGKRATKGTGVARVGVSGSPHSGMEYGGSGFYGKRRRTVAYGYSGDTDERKWGNRYGGFGMSGMGGLG